MLKKRTLLLKLKFTILFFKDRPFYESYPTLDSRDTGPFTRQDGVQNRHKVYSAAYGSTKIEFLILPLLFRQSSSNQIQNIL